MAVYRAISGLQMPSGLPTDVVLNVFHFTGGAGVIATDAIEIGRLIDFLYNQTTPNGALKEKIKATGTVLETRVYDLADPQPRPPTFVTQTWAPTGIQASLPREVALCSSWYKDRNLPRFRGRFYVGPLTINQADAAGNPSGPMIDTLASATSQAVQEARDNSTLQWAVYSRVDGVARDVNKGWVDDAFDTQRRRGPDPTSRLEWASI